MIRDRQEIQGALCTLTCAPFGEVRRRIFQGNPAMDEYAATVADTLDWVLGGPGSVLEEVRRFVERRVAELGFQPVIKREDGPK